jgi:stage III sporulation protein SpoIIIAA
MTEDVPVERPVLARCERITDVIGAFKSTLLVVRPRMRKTTILREFCSVL